MKIRTGFVSNSSTSSFICCVCGNMEAGSDSCGMEDYGFLRCEKEHELEIGCAGEPDDDKYNEDGELKSKHCPICNFTIVSIDDRKKYIYKKFGIKDENIDKEILSKFKSLKDFEKYLEEK